LKLVDKYIEGRQGQERERGRSQQPTDHHDRQGTFHLRSMQPEHKERPKAQNRGGRCLYLRPQPADEALAVLAAVVAGLSLASDLLRVNVSKRSDV